MCNIFFLSFFEDFFNGEIVNLKRESMLENMSNDDDSIDFEFWEKENEWESSMRRIENDIKFDISRQFLKPDGWTKFVVFESNFSLLEDSKEKKFHWNSISGS